MKLPPLLGYINQKEVMALNKIWFHLTKHRVSAQGWKINVPPCINLDIEKYWQPKIKTRLICGNFPIFHEDKRPPYEFIASLYEQFSNCNNSQKLDYQVQKSLGLCHVRAHFISEFLQLYFHIPT